jgi:hypothetical protein
MAILILGGDGDEHATAVRDYLRMQGADAELLNSSDFPKKLQLSFEPVDTPRGTVPYSPTMRAWCPRISGQSPVAKSGQSPVGTIRLPGGRKLAFDEITAVYWRCYNGIATPDLPVAQQAYIAQNDARSLFESFLIRLPARWVNGWRAFQLHQTKPAQLVMVAELGVPVPATLLSNDPDAVLQFAANHARCIFKPVQGGAHTRPVTTRHLTAENLQSLAVSPVTIQEEIRGSDIRVFVAGERVLACEIHTKEADFREDPDPRIEPIELPADVAEQCLRIARKLHLLWTGIDLRRTPEGRHVFLEANPSPMFLGFQQRTGLPLMESLVEVLMANFIEIEE